LTWSIEEPADFGGDSVSEMARQIATIQKKTVNSIYSVGYPVSTALPDA
jgi:hypothetical protein